MFLEIKINKRTGMIENKQQISGDDILAKHPLVMDLPSWVGNARIGTKFTVIDHGYIYERIA